MDPAPLIIGIVLVALPIAAVVGFLLWWRRRLSQRLSSLLGPNPQVQRGTLRAQETVKAPVSGEQVIGYRLRIIEYPRDMVSVPLAPVRYRVLVDTSNVKPFTFKTIDGDHEIAGDGIVLLNRRTDGENNGVVLQVAPPVVIQQILAGRGYSSMEAARPRRLHWWEYVVCDGDERHLIRDKRARVLADQPLAEVRQSLAEYDLPRES